MIELLKYPTKNEVKARIAMMLTSNAEALFVFHHLLFLYAYYCKRDHA